MGGIPSPTDRVPFSAEKEINITGGLLQKVFCYAKGVISHNPKIL